MSGTPKRDVSLTIGGVPVVGWYAISASMSVDTYSTLSADAPFDPERQEIRELFRPYQFRDLILALDGEQLFRGFAQDFEPRRNAEGYTIGIAGAALPATLHQCPEPASAIPVRLNKRTLPEILRIVLAPYGLDFELRGDAGAKFPEVELSPTSPPQEVLATLARQRGRVLTDRPDGRLLCWAPEGAGDPVAHFEEGIPPAENIEFHPSAQDFFSEITGYSPDRTGKKGSRFTLQNPLLQTRVRPMAFEAEDSSAGDIRGATLARFGRMLANAASWTINDIPTWHTPGGGLYRPNQWVTLLAPGVMCYRRTKFLIRTVTYTATPEAWKCSLNLVLPGVFSGAIPEALPWLG